MTQGNPVLHGVSRGERRALINNEGKLRAQGTWGEWEKIQFPAGCVGSAWASEISLAFKNSVFSVLWRNCPNGVVHLAVASLSQVRPSWWEMQRIKNELVGRNATAVEVYPPQSEVVDGADMYHIWVLPNSLPFGLTVRNSQPELSRRSAKRSNNATAPASNPGPSLPEAEDRGGREGM